VVKHPGPDPAEAETTQGGAAEVSKTTAPAQTAPVPNPGISRGRARMPWEIATNSGTYETVCLWIW
jgi:hypothetical protein